MRASWSVMEEAATCAIKLVQSIEYIFRGMGMHNIEQDINAIGMSCIDQLF
jgi:hypothetical protein